VLNPGTKLGSYEVVGTLGAGGMGEVYRARDTKLGRDVALKVLPQAFTQDPQRMARFEREARTLASLNHPNIAAICGLEESGSTRALVMELVEGETLAERSSPLQPGVGTTTPRLGERVFHTAPEITLNGRRAGTPASKSRRVGERTLRYKGEARVSLNATA
jgi:aminoglycoside phosphotransferase (APT) family kinase protein